MSDTRKIPKVRPLSKDVIEYQASALVQEVCPETLEGREAFPILEFCDQQLEDRFQIPFSVALLAPGEEGKLDGHELFVDEQVYRDALANDGRARFTLAHEAAHAILHATQLRAINDSRRGTPSLYRREELRAFEDPEWQANRFAAALLMPVRAVQSLIHRHGIYDADTLSEFVRMYLSVSRSAATIRVKKLIAEERIKLN